ncbi:MAG: hypothetical protein LW822_02825 [Phycisphaeraceae bacterium]|nr:hypothetical protein [Phycisphaeraceae bacterium]
MTTKIILHAFLVLIVLALLPARVVQGQEPVPQARFRCTVINFDGVPVSNLPMGLDLFGPSAARFRASTGLDGSFEVSIPVPAAGPHNWVLNLDLRHVDLSPIERATAEQIWSTTARRFYLSSGYVTLPSAEPVVVTIRLEQSSTVSGVVIVNEAEQSRPLLLQVDKVDWSVPEEVIVVKPVEEPNGRWKIEGLPRRLTLPLLLRFGSARIDAAFVILDSSSGTSDWGTITVDQRQLPEWPELQISAVNVPPELANEPLAADVLDVQSRTFRNLRRYPGQAFFSPTSQPGQTLRLPPGPYRILVHARRPKVVSLIASGTPIPESVAPTVTVVAGQPGTITVDWSTLPAAFSKMFPKVELEDIISPPTPVDTHLDIKLNDTRETYKDPTLRNPLPSPPLPPPDKKTVPEPGKP